MSEFEYRNLKYNVSKGIDWAKEGERLLYICQTFLPEGGEGNIQNVLSLLEKLEEENRLAIDSLAVLKDLLKELSEWNLFEMVEKFENKRNEYKSLLEQCCRVLHECGQLERLISVCEGKISQDRQGHITDVSNLFTELEKQNNLGIGRLEILKTMATEMEKPNLLQQIEEFDKKRKQEEDADRKRRKRQDQTAVVLASGRYAGGRLIGIVTPQCTFRDVTGGIVSVITWMILRRSSSLQEFVKTFNDVVLPLGSILREIREGSLCFTVQAQTSSALEALWKTFQDGTLQKNLQEFLVTEEIKQLVGSEVTLTVEMDEQEYNDALWDLVKNEAQEIEVKEERKGFEDQSSSDSAHARVTDAHPEVKEEVSQTTEFNLLDRIAFVQKYLANLKEAYRMAKNTTDSDFSSQSAPFESGLYKDTGDIQEILEWVDEWMKEISKKLEILTEPGGVATRDEDILGNIQQVRKEMENIRKTLETLGKTEEKKMHGDILGSIQQVRKEMENIRKTLETLAKTEEKKMHGEPTTSLPSRESVDDEKGIHTTWFERLERLDKERLELRDKERLELLEGRDFYDADDVEWLERLVSGFGSEVPPLSDSSPSVPSPSSVGGGLEDAKVEVEPKQKKQKEGSREEFK